ncbi:MAG: FecR domain-containing protein, partial [Alphaproteobacteria bacterium]
MEIGNVEEIRLALYGTVAGGDSERLFKNDNVYADELIETVKKSGAQIRFLDDTDLWLGPSSQLTLDTFIYDPNQGTGEMVAELGVGLFRFVTGNLPNEGFEILTPVATIGIRGTDFSVALAENVGSSPPGDARFFNGLE